MKQEVDRYAHARQFRRMRKVIKRQRTIVGRLQREVVRKMTALSQALQECLGHTMDKAKRMAGEERRLLKRGHAIEPLIGHLKSDHRMDRCHLKGAPGRCVARDVVRSGLQHPLAVVHDRQERLGSFVVLVACGGFAGYLAEIGRTHPSEIVAMLISKLGLGLK